MSKYKANHNLLMPDGKTEVSAGQIFEYNGDTFGFEDVIVQVDDNVKADVIVPEAKTIHRPEKAGETIPANDENPHAVHKMSEEELRARGKELKITSAHNMNLDKLAEKIAEKEAEISAKVVAEAEAKEAAALEALKQPDAGFEVDNVPETPANDGEANA